MPSLFIQKPATINVRSTANKKFSIKPVKNINTRVTIEMDRFQGCNKENKFKDTIKPVTKEKLVEDILDDTLTCDDFISKYFNLVSSDKDTFALAPLQPIPSIEFDQLETIAGDSSVSTLELLEDEVMEDTESIMSDLMQ